MIEKEVFLSIDLQNSIENQQCNWSKKLCLFYFFFFADGSIDAPPSFKPAKKYSDISGLPVSAILCVYWFLNVFSCFFHTVC